MNRKTKLRTAAAAVATLFAVCACGSNPDQATTTANTEPEMAKISIAMPGTNTYFSPWAEAAKDAAEEWGFQATYDLPAGTDWSLAQQNTLVDSLAAKGYNGFGFFPGDAQGTVAEQQKLAERGIFSININGCTNDPGPALLCVSTNVYDAAYYQTEQLIEAIGGSGKIAVLTSLLTDPNPQLRIKAAEDAVAATNGQVILEQVVADIDSPDTAPPAINALLSSKGDELDGMFATSWYPSVASAIAMTDSPEYRHIKVITAENSDQVMEALSNGYIYGTLFQNTYGQAYVAAYILYKVIQEGCTVNDQSPAFTTTDQTSKLLQADVLVVTRDNMHEFVDKPESLPKDTEKLLQAVNDSVLSCP
ncbi:MAG: sugar ABC transporter substrate-binding protein [Micrococcales bacterium]|nr:sugar ABC transporter substrate-binding protein [Micrococcales bacterium]